MTSHGEAVELPQGRVASLIALFQQRMRSAERTHQYVKGEDFKLENQSVRCADGLISASVKVKDIVVAESTGAAREIRCSLLQRYGLLSHIPSIPNP